MAFEQNPRNLSREDVFRRANIWWLGPLCLQALWHLAVARLRFAKLAVPLLLASNAEIARAARGPTQARPGDCSAVERISYVIPRIACRLPFRADCLVQAMAAQQWLHELGIASRIVIGVEHPQGKDFGAHAWLSYGDFVVTGGETGQYAPLV